MTKVTLTKNIKEKREGVGGGHMALVQWLETLFRLFNFDPFVGDCNSNVQMNLSPKFSDLQEIKHGLQHFNAPNFQNYNKVSILYNKIKHDVILRPKFYQTTLMLLKTPVTKNYNNLTTIYNSCNPPLKPIHINAHNFQTYNK